MDPFQVNERFAPLFTIMSLSAQNKIYGMAEETNYIKVHL